MQGQMKIFRVGSRQFRESLRELLRELWVSYWSSRERPFREWNFVFREWNLQFRELLREYPGTLRELREWPFHSESVFPEIGVVPRLLINCNFKHKLKLFFLQREPAGMATLRCFKIITYHSCPTYQLWPFSFPPENPPKITKMGSPKWISRNSPDRGFLWKFSTNPEFPGISRPPRFQHFGVPIFSVSGGNEVDMLGTAENLHKISQK